MRKITDMLDEVFKSGLLIEKYEFGIVKSRNICKGSKQVTLNVSMLNIYGRKIMDYIANLIKEELLDTFKIDKYKNICIVGLGNREIINDSLGPKVLQKVLVTRGLEIQPQLSVIYPSVYAQTGIKSAEMIISICKDLKPDLIVFIDALATLSLERLCSSFQIIDKGIRAGSGINNQNMELTKELLNCELISIGVPMMIYAENFFRNKNKKNIMKDLILSPADTKKVVNLVADIIAEALNAAIFPQFDKEEIQTMIN